MIGMAGQDCDGTVKLLQQHDANQMMRPCRGPERNGKRRLFPQHGRQPIVAADDERNGGSVLGAPSLQPPRQGCAAYALTMLVQDYDGCIVRDDIGDGD